MTETPRPVNAFVPDPQDPLLAEHQAILRWIEEALAALPERETWKDVDLKSLASGKALLGADAESAKRHVIAALRQMRHWDEVRNRIKATAATSIEQMNPHQLPGWSEAWARRRKAQAVAAALLRRALPFSKDDLLAVLECCSVAEPSSYALPIGAIARALERYGADREIEPDLREAVRLFGARLQGSHEKDAQRLGTNVAQLGVDAAGTEPGAVPLAPPPSPAPAGAASVLTELKRRLRVSGAADSPTAEVGPDRFPLRADSILSREHQRLNELLEQIRTTDNYLNYHLSAFDAGAEVLALDPHARGRVLLAAAERHTFALLAGVGDYREEAVWRSRYTAPTLVAALEQKAFDLTRDELFDLLLYCSIRPAHERGTASNTRLALLALLEREASTAPFSDGERYVLHRWRASLIAGPPLGAPAAEIVKISRWVGDGAGFYLVPGEAWADALNAGLTRLPSASRGAWVDLLRHLLGATSARPSGKWTKTATKRVESIGPAVVRASLQTWLPLVAQGQTRGQLGSFIGDTRGGSDVIHPENANALRGMLWLVPTLPKPAELARIVTAVALSAYKKVPGIGPRAVKVGNAAVYALSDLGSVEAVGQLAMLKVRVRFGTAQKEIEKAFDAAAQALGLPRDQIEEMGVPSYGLEEVGRQVEAIGGYRAEVLVTGTDVTLRWSDAAGKALKSVPTTLSQEHKDELKELQQSLKDIQAMLPAQRDRIDALFLAEKTWPFAVWRERYIDHPLVGTLGRRLIWCVGADAATFADGQGADIDDAPIGGNATATVRLWHPAGRGMEEITAWRRRLRELGITQPFKQAHREIYLLTDAERRTRTYSNRFAAHVLRQHQFNALCAARGWKNKLRLMVDDTYPPASRELPAWGLRAEFWIEGIGADYGTDTSDAGVYLRVASDQVRFYRTEAAENIAHAGGGGYTTNAGGPGGGDVNEPIPLEDVPPLAFSEIMRDVDLFVGVASVGNDPAWQDGGPGGRYREYWHSYSFGELSATAATRREALQQLVPLLKIAARCSFEERFLVVRGDKRTYKIHLGSGNILMEPNDQYLCIVPDARARSGGPAVLLPFEGDSVLSVILSKALLLADDTKITDPTIVQQIAGA
jgi:hypothetical protein